MAWTNAGTTHYHSKLGLPDKGRPIEELGFYWVLLNTIPRLFGLKSYPQLLNLTPKCHGKQSRPYQVIEVHIRLLKSISICFLNILSIIVSQCLGHKDCDIVYFGIFKNVYWNYLEFGWLLRTPGWLEELLVLFKVSYSPHTHHLPSFLVIWYTKTLTLFSKIQQSI